MSRKQNRIWNKMAARNEYEGESKNHYTEQKMVGKTPGISLWFVN